MCAEAVLLARLPVDIRLRVGTATQHTLWRQGGKGSSEGEHTSPPLSTSPGAGESQPEDFPQESILSRLCRGCSRPGAVGRALGGLGEEGGIAGMSVTTGAQECDGQEVADSLRKGVAGSQESERLPTGRGALPSQPVPVHSHAHPAPTDTPAKKVLTPAPASPRLCHALAQSKAPPSSPQPQRLPLSPCPCLPLSSLDSWSTASSGQRLPSPHSPPSPHNKPPWLKFKRGPAVGLLSTSCSPLPPLPAPHKSHPHNTFARFLGAAGILCSHHPPSTGEPSASWRPQRRSVLRALERSCHS